MFLLVLPHITVCFCLTVIPPTPIFLRLSSHFCLVHRSPIPAWNCWALVSIYCNQNPVPAPFRQEPVSDLVRMPLLLLKLWCLSFQARDSDSWLWKYFLIFLCLTDNVIFCLWFLTCCSLFPRTFALKLCPSFLNAHLFLLFISRLK